MKSLYGRYVQAMGDKEETLLLFPRSYDYDQVLKILEKDYNLENIPCEGTCISFDCRELCHVLFSRGESECDVPDSIGRIAGFMLKHPELTLVSIGQCETRHPEKKNMAKLELSVSLCNSECSCTCACDSLPANARNSLSKGENAWGGDALFECHRFQKNKDRVFRVTHKG
ncbi:hypothetical protein [Brazilian marseillevirus]|uniref:hypothetical protein n=1 Tax=Brazilian marseillevirus TaxID=1813599 RepID=UPI000786164D|nr:hypothetical protein A3303_gp157 [Brazilian marseillevirus]AMQ10665.1 hypothetical protein [Brazilian marseillevirus]